MAILLDLQKAVSMSNEASITVTAAFKEANLANVVKEAFFPQEHPELKVELQTWATGGKMAALRPAISVLGLGKTPEDVQQMINKLLVEWNIEYAQGAVPQMPNVMIVGQKICCIIVQSSLQESSIKGN